MLVRFLIEVLRILKRKGAETKSLLASLHEMIKVGGNEAPFLPKLSYEPRERFAVSAEHSKILDVIAKRKAAVKRVENPRTKGWLTYED
jgi:hypothetical protein